MERAPETAALAGQAGRQTGDHRQPQSRSQPRGVFEVDEDAALAELKRAWADGDFTRLALVTRRLGPASAGAMLTAASPGRRFICTCRVSGFGVSIRVLL